MGSPRNFLGASDAPTLLGLGHQSEDELAARILHNVEREVTPETQALFDRGHAVEPRLLAAYEAIYGVVLERKLRVPHPAYPFMSAAPDGKHGNVLVETKTRNRFAQNAKDESKKFGWAGSAMVPAVNAAQVQFQLECCRVDTCHMFVAFGEDTEDGWRTDWVSRYIVMRDEVFGSALVTLALDFWRRRIEANL